MLVLLRQDVLDFVVKLVIGGITKLSRERHS
jgi:hypothetical protein